jgi:tetratricopeptide (TPR) repeat protein
VSTDLAAARKAFEDELTVDPTNANAAYELGEMDRTAGDFQSARQRFEQALSHDAAFDHALVGLGRTLIALERPAEALKPLHAALKINPQSDVAFYQIALAYRALGNDAAQERALADFNRVRSLALQRKGAIPATLRDVTPQIVDSKSPR